MRYPIGATIGAMRLATSADADAITNIHVSAYEASLGEVVSREVLDVASASRLPMWRALIAEPPTGQAVFVVERDEIVGFVSTGPTRESGVNGAEGEVYALFVHPGQWKTGVGGALLVRALEHMTSLGLSHAKLWVLDANHRARQFYESRGWSNTEVVREDDRGRFFRYAKQI